MDDICEFRITGHLGKDVILSNTNNGIVYTTVSVASKYRYKKGNNQWTDGTRWNYITVWRKDAEYLCQYAGKGSYIFIQGVVETVIINKQGGDDFKQQMTARGVKILRNPQKQQEQGQQNTQQPPSNQPPQYQQPMHPPDDFIEDDIPF